MKIHLTWKYILAFFALNMIMGELHEQAHINTGFLLCGCYGPRDFSVWQTCASCSRSGLAFLATLAGPIFSYCMMWLGALWVLYSNHSEKRRMGFALLFANLPFARIFTALMGGGDEKVVTQFLLGEDQASILAKVIAAGVVLLVCLAPIILVFKKLAPQQRWWLVIGFSVVPLIYGMLYHHIFLNGLLHKGIAANTEILGTPNLILYHSALMAILLLLTGKALWKDSKEARLYHSWA